MNWQNSKVSPGRGAVIMGQYWTWKLPPTGIGLFDWKFSVYMAVVFSTVLFYSTERTLATIVENVVV